MTSDNKTDGLVDHITSLARVTQAMLEAFEAIEERLVSLDARLETIEKNTRRADVAKGARSKR